MLYDLVKCCVPPFIWGVKGSLGVFRAEKGQMYAH
jgi:hypothetical protein